MVNPKDKKKLKLVTIPETYHVRVSKICSRKTLICRVAGNASAQFETVWTNHCCAGMLVELLIRILPALDTDIDLCIVEDGLWNTMVNQVANI